MRTTTQLADYFNISSARRLNQILQELNIQKKDKFGRWVFIDPTHKKFEQYREIKNNEKTIAIRIFTDEGKSFIENILIEKGFYKKINRGTGYEEYLLKNKKYRNRKYC